MQMATTEAPVEESLDPFPVSGHPPDAVIFDLDGTLTETELLKVREDYRPYRMLSV